MKYTRIILTLLFMFLLFTGCKSKTITKPIETSTPVAATPTSTPTKPIETKFFAPYTGEEVTKEVSENAAFMCIIENSDAARPQSGLNGADIVYEAMTEGGTTRFLALYQKDNADKIGPVRSMRTYFMDLAYEYKLPFGHCGGSHDALDRIKKEGSMSMDEMANGSYYWRDTTIKIQEHSLYTSSEKLKSLAAAKGYVKPQLAPLKFDRTYWEKLNSSQTSNVTIRFNGSYTSAYSFKDGLYYKSMGKATTLNKEDNKPVAIKNIVIQNVNYRTRQNELYLDADLIGQGDGYIISDGKSVKVSWSKADLNSQTIFKDESGNIIPLNPGKTWWHLLDQNANLTIN